MESHPSYVGLGMGGTRRSAGTSATKASSHGLSAISGFSPGQVIGPGNRVTFLLSQRPVSGHLMKPGVPARYSARLSEGYQVPMRFREVEVAARMMYDRHLRSG